MRITMRMLGLLIWLGLGCSKPAETIIKDERTDLRTRKTGSDWPCFLGPTQNSVSPEKGIRTVWPKEGLEILWEAELGLGYAPPAIHQGRLFHVDRFGKNIRLTCRNAESGKFLWKFEYPTDYVDMYGYDSGPRCTPIVDEGRVYIHGPEGMLYCLDTIQGTEIWHVNTQKDFHFQQNFFGVGSCPLIVGDLLLVAVGGSAVEDRPADFRQLKGNGTGIVAFDKKTGKVQYKATNELASYSTPILATINNKQLALYFGRSSLIGIEPQTGKLEWEFKWRAKSLESVNASNPVVVNDQILITECYEKGSALLKVDRGQLKPIWTDDDKDRDEKRFMCHWNTPVHVDGYVYGSSGRHESNAELRCLKLDSGEVQWSEPALSRCSLLLVDGHFLCLNERGLLLLLKINPKKYDEVARWKIPDLRYPTWAAPVLSNGLLYLRGNGRLICVELIPAP